MSDFSNKTVEKLVLTMCFFLDTPSSGLDCSTVDSSICIYCKVRSTYLTRESTSELYSPGHLICWALWTLCISVGILGVFGNICIITILHKRCGSDKGFDFLLKILACFDICCCITGLITSTDAIYYFGNTYGRGLLHFQIINHIWIIFQIFRSASQYMTIAITIERFLIITLPFRAQSWFGVLQSRLIAAFPVALAVLLKVPRYTSTYVGENEYRYDKLNIPSLRHMDYYLKPTSLNEFWIRTLGIVHYQVDLLAPLPILLIFNFLSYIQVRKMSKRRNEMKMAQKRNVQAVNMFLPVVMVLLCVNLIPMSMAVTASLYGVVYREIIYLVYLSITLNSSVNFVIYYTRSGLFCEEAQTLLASWSSKIVCKSRDKGNQSNINNESQGVSGLSIYKSSSDGMI